MGALRASLLYTAGKLALAKGITSFIRVFPVHKPSKHESWDKAKCFSLDRRYDFVCVLCCGHVLLCWSLQRSLGPLVEFPRSTSPLNTSLATTRNTLSSKPRWALLEAGEVLSLGDGISPGLFWSSGCLSVDLTLYKYIVQILGFFDMCQSSTGVVVRDFRGVIRGWENGFFS